MSVDGWPGSSARRRPLGDERRSTGGGGDGQIAFSRRSAGAAVLNSTDRNSWLHRRGI